MPIQTVQNMIEWIEANIKDNPTLSGMSGYFGYSPFYCSGKFREHVGMTFKKYTALRKLSLAAFEIKNTKKKLIEIALEHGFSSHEAFTRAFTSAYGCTPFDYRSKNLKVSFIKKAKISYNGY